MKLEGAVLGIAIFHLLPRSIFALCLLLLSSCKAQREERPVNGSQPSSTPVASRSALDSSAEPLRASPRPILPQSGGVIASGSVIFVWQGAGSVVQLARDRAFTRDLSTIQGLPVPAQRERLTATSSDLSDGVWFWRVSDGASGAVSHVWPFRVQHVQGVSSGGSQLDGADVNCDGSADILLHGQVVLGGDPPAAEAHCAFDALGIEALKPDPAFPDSNWGQLIRLGDVDGDGCGDAALLVARNSRHEANPPAVCLWFRGRPGLSGTWQAAGICPRGIQPLGDYDNDGYADFSAYADPKCAQVPCAEGLYLGSSAGPVSSSAQGLPQSAQLLGSGDFDGDGLVDLWALRGGAGEASRADYFPSAQSGHEPSRSMKIPGPLVTSITAGIGSNQRWGLLGFSGVEHHFVAWQADGSSATTHEYQWPHSFNTVIYGPMRWAGNGLSIVGPPVPFTGPGRRGTWLVAPEPEIAKQVIWEFSFDSNGLPRFLGKVTVQSSASLNGVIGFEPIGDVTGDGFDDVLVSELDEMGDYLLSLYRGSATGFQFVREVAGEDTVHYVRLGTP